MKDGLVYRHYTTSNPDEIFTQLVVPSKYRNIVTKLAHDSIMSGHLVTSRTVSRVLSEFYWPGIQSDIRRFCQSCDVSQRTYQKVGSPMCLWSKCR